MNSKAILGASLAAVFAIAMITPTLASNSSFLDITSTKVTSNNKVVQITTAQAIPAGVALPEYNIIGFGYAIVYDSGKALGFTSHVLDDSTPQVDDSDQRMHTHVVTGLAVDPALCPIGVVLVSATDSVGTTTIAANKLNAANLPTEHGNLVPGSAFGFTIGLQTVLADSDPSNDGDAVGSGLCVNPHP